MLDILVNTIFLGAILYTIDYLKKSEKTRDIERAAELVSTKIK